MGMTLNCIHVFVVTGSFLYWCVMRLASHRFFKNSCIYLRILIISYLATLLGTNSLSVLLCRKAVNQSINQFEYFHSLMCFLLFTYFQCNVCIYCLLILYDLVCCVLLADLEGKEQQLLSSLKAVRLECFLSSTHQVSFVRQHGQAGCPQTNEHVMQALIK